MIEAVLWMLGALACYAAYVGLMTSDEQYRRDLKHRCHHRWQG